MKKLGILISIALGLIIFLPSCDEDEVDNMNHRIPCPTLEVSDVPDNVEASFETKYPGETVDIWFNKDNRAYVAYFEDERGEHLVYFEESGEFIGTENDRDHDGRFEEVEEEFEFRCDDFSQDELADLAVNCLTEWIEILEMEQISIPGEIEDIQSRIEDVEAEIATLQNGGATNENCSCNLNNEIADLELYIGRLNLKIAELELELASIALKIDELNLLIQEIQCGHMAMEELCDIYFDCAMDWEGEYEENDCGCHHEDEWTEGEEWGYRECFEFVFPINVSYADGTTATFANGDEMKLAYENCEMNYDNEECFEFVFPFTVAYEEEEVIINNYIELREAYALCERWYEEEEGWSEENGCDDDEDYVDIWDDDGCECNTDND